MDGKHFKTDFRKHGLTLAAVGKIICRSPRTVEGWIGRFRDDELPEFAERLWTGWKEKEGER